MKYLILSAIVAVSFQSNVQAQDIKSEVLNSQKYSRTKTVRPRRVEIKVNDKTYAEVQRRKFRPRKSKHNEVTEQTLARTKTRVPVRA